MTTEALDTIFTFIAKNYQFIISVLLNLFIAYHIYFLSKKLSFQAKFNKKNETQKILNKHLYNIKKEGLNSTVYLVNIDRYYKDYPNGKEKRFQGYTDLKAEIKDTRFDGVEFFSESPIYLYKNEKGILSREANERGQKIKAFPVSIVPYEWIEGVDLYGDEFSFSPLIFCKFKTISFFWKKFLFLKYPYNRTIYYTQNPHYDASDFHSMEFLPLNESIDNF